MDKVQNHTVTIYSRKSKFTGKGESIENQIELCRQYIHTHFPQVEDHHILVYEDEGFSGGNTQRPQFKQMMADARAGAFSAIVCYRLDRISRNIGDFAQLIEELDRLGIAFLSIKEQFDTTSPMGRAMMYISSVFSQLERETIAERIRDNMYELSKTGRWLGGTTPTGYASESLESVTIDGKVKRACRLKLLDEEAALVRTIFEVFLETESLTKTETFLLQRGHKTKRGKAFSRFSIKNILLNPVYATADPDAYRYLTDRKAALFAGRPDFDGTHGVIAYNRTIQKAGKAHRIRPMSEWIVAVGGHPGIVSGADWIRSQEIMERNRSKSYRKPRGNTALLSGLLRCAHCGSHMRPKLTSRRDGNGEPLYSYVCTMKERSRCQLCAGKNVNGNALDRAVCQEIKKLGECQSRFLQRVRSGQELLDQGRRQTDTDRDRLKAQLEEVEGTIAALVSALAKATGTAAEEYVLQQIDEMHRQRLSLLERIAQMERAAAGILLTDEQFQVLRQMLSSFGAALDSMAVEQKRGALRALISKVVWDGQCARIHLFGSDDLEAAGRE